MKTKLQNEGSEVSQFVGQLKMQAHDGKMRLIDVADTEQLFRLIQSIPSPKAEPFKQCMAQVASERLDQMKGKSRRTVARQIKQLQKEGVIIRVGSDKTGYWEVINQNGLICIGVGRNRKNHYFCGGNVGYGISSYGNADKLARNNSWYNAISRNIKI